MKSKKIYLILIAIMLFVFSNISAYAESEIKPKMSKEAIERIIKDNLNNYFNMQISDKNLKDNLEFEEEGMTEKPVWSLGYKSNSRTDINIEIDDATGKLIYFSKWINCMDKEKKDTIKITEDQAKKIAEDFLKKINPNEFKNVKLENNENYQFTYIRIVNGINFEKNEIKVEVDKETGKILEYSIDWDNNIIFEDVKNIISKDKALEIFKKESNIDLVYVNPYEDIEKPILVYKISSNLVDSKKGISVDYKGLPIQEAKHKDINKEEKEKILNSATKTSNSNVKLSKDETIIFMKDRLKELLNCDFEFKKVDYVGDNNEELKGAFIEKDSQITGDIIINSKTKDIISFSRNYEENESIKSNITWEQGYDKAIEVIKRYYPDKIMNINTRNEYVNDGYYYDFHRVENELVYEYNTIAVELDQETGKVNSINLWWSDNVKFQDKDKAIGIQKAKDIFFSNYEANSFYQMIESKDGSKKAILVYELIPGKKGCHYMDAITGTFLDNNGEEVK